MVEVESQGQVLLVDDEHELRLTLRALLEPEFTVAEAANMSAALEELAKARYDVVVTDFQMPGGTGVELLRAMANRFPKIIGILVTGFGEDPEVRALRDGGHVLVLEKPAEPEELLARVRNATTMSRLEREMDS